MNEKTHMHDINGTDKVISGDEASKLLLKGRDVWNKFFDSRKDYKVDFSHFNFLDFNLENKLSKTDFSGFIFPDGGVNFGGATFRLKTVTFNSADFGNGDVSFFGMQVIEVAKLDFEGARFGNGNVDFAETNFICNNISFFNTKFGSGRVSFDSCKFEGFNNENISLRFNPIKSELVSLSFTYSSLKNLTLSFDFSLNSNCEFLFNCLQVENSQVYFHNCDFGNELVDFSGTDFSNSFFVVRRSNFLDSETTFQHCIFAQEHSIFQDVTFGNGNVIFAHTRFNIPYLNFGSVDFGSGKIDFSNSDFADGLVVFSKSKHAQTRIYFEHVNFKNSLLMNSLEGSQDILELSFKHSSFGSAFDLSNNNFRCFPDLTNTSHSHQISLRSIGIDISSIHSQRADLCPEHEISKIQRLKEIADNNNDHDGALNFHALELEMQRNLEGTSKLSALLDRAYQLFSNYGRSVFRPSISLLGTWLLFAMLYFCMADGGSYYDDPGHLIGTALSYSGGYTIPLLPDGRFSRLEGLDFLFDGKSFGWLHLANFCQGLLSTALLFLIGLGLRNRFRI